MGWSGLLRAVAWYCARRLWVGAAALERNLAPEDASHPEGTGEKWTVAECPASRAARTGLSIPGAVLLEEIRWELDVLQKNLGYQPAVRINLSVRCTAELIQALTPEGNHSVDTIKAIDGVPCRTDDGLPDWAWTIELAPITKKRTHLPHPLQS